MEIEKYEEALADFGKAIELDESDIWALAQRGETYRLMGCYTEALGDYDKAIALDENDDCNWYNKALVYHLTDQQLLFHSALRTALDIAHSQIALITSQDEEYYRLRFGIALYLLVDGSTVEAGAEYSQLLSQCSFISQLQAAVTDLEEFLTVQPMNEFAQDMLALVKKRIEEVKS